MLGTPLNAGGSGAERPSPWHRRSRHRCRERSARTRRHTPTVTCDRAAGVRCARCKPVRGWPRGCRGAPMQLPTPRAAESAIRTGVFSGQQGPEPPAPGAFPAQASGRARTRVSAGPGAAEAALRLPRAGGALGPRESRPAGPGHRQRCAPRTAASARGLSTARKPSPAGKRRRAGGVGTHRARGRAASLP